MLPFRKLTLSHQPPKSQGKSSTQKNQNRREYVSYQKGTNLYPICSMGLEYVPTFGSNFMVNAGKYSSPMEHLGIDKPTNQKRYSDHSAWLFHRCELWTQPIFSHRSCITGKDCPEAGSARFRERWLWSWCAIANLIPSSKHWLNIKKITYAGYHISYFLMFTSLLFSSIFYAYADQNTAALLCPCVLWFQEQIQMFFRVPCSEALTRIKEMKLVHINGFFMFL